VLAAAGAPAVLAALELRERALREEGDRAGLDGVAEGGRDRVPRAVADLEQAAPSSGERSLRGRFGEGVEFLHEDPSSHLTEGSALADIDAPEDLVRPGIALTGVARGHLCPG